MSTPLEPDKIYHVYNRANGNERLFRSKENYRFFLRKYEEHIFPVALTYAYCLMPNHFHFLLRIKPEKELKDLPKFETSRSLSHSLSKRFSNLFSSYTQAYNKQQGRKGSLFMKNFKRKPVNDETYLRKVIHYIHSNPVHHGFRTSMEKWEFSSYNPIISKGKSVLKSDEVLVFFGGMENFIYCHQHPPELTGINWKE